MGREAKVFYARLSELIADTIIPFLKQAWVKRKIRFGLLSNGDMSSRLSVEKKHCSSRGYEKHRSNKPRF